MSDLRFIITADNTQFNRALSEVERGISDAKSRIELGGMSIDAFFRKAAASAAKLGLSLSAIDFVKNVATTRGEFQQLETAFQTMLGDGREAEKLLRQITKTAAITPFDMQGVAQGAKQLLAYGTAAEDVNDMLLRLGDIAAGLSIPLGDLVYLYGTTMTQGRMFTQDLRQFQGRGIPIADELAKQFGVARSEVAQLVTDGKVGAENVRQAILSMTDAGSQFGGLMAAQSQSITGQLSNIGDAIDMMFNDLGKQSEGAIGAALDGVSYVVEHYRQFGGVILSITSAYAIYKASVKAVGTLHRLEAEQVRREAAERAAAAAEAAAEKQKEISLVEKEIELIEREIDARKRALEVSKGISAGGTEAISPAIGGNPEIDALEKKKQKQLEFIESLKAEQEATLQNAMAELDIADERHMEAVTELENARKRKEWADERVESAKEYMEAMREAAEYEGTDNLEGYAEYNAAISEQLAAAKELETATERENTAATALNSAEKQLNTVQAEMNALQTNAATAAEATNTTATATNTAVQRGNTASVIANTVAQKAHAAWSKSATTAQLLWNAAVVSAKNALNALKVAWKTNPLGLIATALTSIVGLIYSFNSSAEEATGATKRFGEEAAKSISDVENLLSIVNSASSESKMYRDAMDGLVKIYGDYGIKLREENGLLREANENRKTLIGLIKQEGIERLYANQKAAASDTYNDKIESVQEEIAGKIESMLGKNSDLYAGIGMTNIIANMDRLKEAQQEMANVAMKSRAERSRDLAHYNKVVEETIASTLEAARANGLNGNQIATLRKQFSTFIPQIIKASQEYDSAVSTIENARAAENRLNQETANLTASQETAAHRARLLKKDVSHLGSAINDLLAKYSENNINFTMTVSTAKVPGWMRQQLGMEGKKGEAGGSLDSAKSRAAFWAGELQYLMEHGLESRVYNGKEYSREMVAQRAAEYAAAAGKIDAAIAEAAAKKDKGKKTSGKAYDPEEAALKQAQLAEAYRQQLEKLQERLQDSITDTRIELMAEGTDREIEEIRKNAQRELRELDTQLDEIAKAMQERDKKTWLEGGKGRKESGWAKTEAGKRTLAEYRQMVLAENDALREAFSQQGQLVRQLQQRQEAEARREEARRSAEALRELAKTYGQYAERRAAIVADYGERMSKEGLTPGEKKLLQRQMQDEVQQLDFDELKKSINWEKAFGDLGSASDAALRTMREQLRRYLEEEKDLKPDVIREVADAIRNIDLQLAGRNPFRSFANSFRNARMESEALASHIVSTRKKVAVKGEDGKETGQYARVSTPMPLLEAYRQADAEERVRLRDLEITYQQIDAEGNLVTVTRKLGDLIDKNNKKNNKKQGSWLTGGLLDEAQEEAVRKISGTVSAMSDAGRAATSLMDTLGIKLPEDVGAGINKTLDGMGKFSQGMQTFISNPIAGSIQMIDGLVTGITGMAETIGAVFGLNANYDQYNALLAQYEGLISVWDEVIGKKKEYISESYGDEIVKAGREAEKVGKNIAKANRELGKAWLASGAGLGSHSQNVRQLKAMTTEQLRQASQAVGFDVQSNGLYQLFDLTGEQLQKLKEDAPAFWAKLDENTRKYLQGIIDAEEQVKEAQEAWMEQMTGVSFDGFYDNFLSMVSDMDTGFREMTENFEEYLRKAALSSIVGEQFKARLQQLYGEFARYGEGGFTASEMDELRSRYLSIAEEARDTVEAWDDILGFQPSTTSGSSGGSTKGFSAMSQDSADELNGRFAALQVSSQGILGNVAAMMETLRSFSPVAEEGNRQLGEVVLLMQLANTRLAAIAEATEGILVRFGQRIESIDDSLRNKL